MSNQKFHTVETDRLLPYCCCISTRYYERDRRNEQDAFCHPSAFIPQERRDGVSRKPHRRSGATASPFRRNGITVPAQRHHRSGATA